jgi:hypothetical protein
MVALGQTTNPTDLIPGDPDAIAQTVIQLYNYGVLLTEAGQGLTKIDTTSSWTGPAGDAFRERFKGQPDAWLEAGSAFSSAAKALDAYIPILVWAQNEAGVAIGQWAKGDKKAADLTLTRAEGRLSQAADTANGTVGAERDKAPPHPSIWDDIGHFFSSVGNELKTAGENAVDALASLGNAALQNPLGDLGVVGGLALATASAGGEVLGVALDVTGVGAVVGVPVNVLSAAGIATGITMMAAGTGDLISNADGPDRVDPISTSGGTSEPAGTPDPQVTPGTPEYQTYLNELAQDPAHAGQVSPKSAWEAKVAIQAQADGLIDGPVTRTPLDADGNDIGDFTSGDGQVWDVKSSPDQIPDYFPNAGRAISSPQSPAAFQATVEHELAQGNNVLLDPGGMSAGRLAQLQQIVESNPSWAGRVVWGS